ncbi:MAG TPA: threonine synthase [Egibacteraceae bacterium]|nr:threonine synthase [Egibacteraceae bacterium]
MSLRPPPDVVSCLSHLEGALSGAVYPADELRGLDPADGRPLLARYDLAAAGRTVTAEAVAGRRAGGLWRWWELLPVRDPTHALHLGEGGTPLLVAPRLGEALGVPGLRVKAEGANPTGSFKARGMAVAVSRAAELGARSLVAPSAGNAGGALAAYGAAAALPVTVLMPADVPAANRDEALACGARVILVEGLISDCGRLAGRLAARTGAFDLSTLKEPYRVEGKKTMGFELAEQSAWRLPDVVVYPTGGGTGLIGMWKAFQELEALGLVGPRRPRMVSVQAAGCAPLARAFAAGERFAAPWDGEAATRAGGLRVPATLGDFLVLGAVWASGGTALAVPEDGIDELQVLAGRRGAGYVGPETAAALAGVRLLAERGELEADEDVVVFDTGVGHKCPAPGLPRPPVVDPGVDEDRLVALAG